MAQTNTADLQKKTVVPNKSQVKCIEKIDGPVMVLAGPGTGKTFTVIERIKYILSKGVSPDFILCLTFSEAAATEMKVRLIREIGTVASAVTINTYHAFCNVIIKQYPGQFELMDGVSLISEINKRNLMQECIDQYNPKFYRTKWGDSLHFITELLSAVDEIKKSRVSKEQYFEMLNTHPDWQGKMDAFLLEWKEREAKGKLVKTFLSNFETHERKMGKAREAWDLYELYFKKQQENNFIDYTDMINLVLDAFESDETFLKKVASKYRYFLVDEYQDTNYSQNEIVFKLAEGSNSDNIFVVGDDDQIIYCFQGAQTDTLERFLFKYPETTVICLEENNRSTQTILDLSYKVISQDDLRLENNDKFTRHSISKRLTAKNSDIIQKDKKLSIAGFGDIQQENNYIVGAIKKIIESGELPINDKGEVNYSEIAVLTKQNVEIEEFARLLKAQNIPFQIKSTRSIFELRPSIIIYFYLKALENNELYADKLFGLLLCKPFDFERADYNYLLELHRLNHKDFITNIQENIDYNWKDKNKIQQFISTYNELSELRAHESLKNLLIQLINKTGILQYYLSSDINKIQNIYAIKKIIDEAAELSSFNKTAGSREFIAHLDLAYSEDIQICIDKDDYIQNAVQLLTLHGSKGREFEYIFIPNLTAINWEKKRNPAGVNLPIEKVVFSEDKELAKNAELLRLMFVGITRGKHAVNLSYSVTIKGKPQELTAYIANILQYKTLFDSCSYKLEQEDYSEEIAKSLTVVDYDYHREFKDELNARVKDFILSPSTLNSYLNCPKEFLYSVILKIPVMDKDTDTLNYGSAVHQTLEWAANNAKENSMYPEFQRVLDIFNKKLSAKPFISQLKRVEYQERGLNSFTKYYPRFISVPIESIEGTEFSFNYVPVNGYFLKGFIDRIEKNGDGTYSLYDYKTGSAKSATQIADGKVYEHYLNQLRFYKFAFETLKEGAEVSKVGLIFVEEHDKSFYTRLCNEDNRIIKNKITRAYEGIRNLDFDPVDKEERKVDNCKYCDYKMLCRLEVI